MRNFLDESCRENQNTHFRFKDFFENRDAYEINVVEPEAKNDVSIWRIRVACWIIKTTRKHAQAHAQASRNSYTQVRMRARTNTHANNVTIWRITRCMLV